MNNDLRTREWQASDLDALAVTDTSVWAEDVMYAAQAAVMAIADQYAHLQSRPGPFEFACAVERYLQAGLADFDLDDPESQPWAGQFLLQYLAGVEESAEAGR